MATRMMASSGLRQIGRIAIGVSMLAIVAGCATSEAPASSQPPASIAPQRSVTPAVGLVRSDLVRVLGERDLVLSDTQAAVQRAEAAMLASAPRAVYQVVLPDDPTRGYIVVYEFADPSRAAAAAAEQQAYLATGPGRVQTPQGTVTIIRQVGTTVVLYEWLPGASRDDRAPAIQTALETLGVGYPVAN
jgi:hypothetical protein